MNFNILKLKYSFLKRKWKKQTSQPSKKFYKNFGYFPGGRGGLKFGYEGKIFKGKF